MRLLLLLVLVVFVARAFWQLMDGVMAGIAGPRKSAPPLPGVAMVRDPVCGTFLLPERAISIVEGTRRLHFCSAACRDTYRAQHARLA